MLLDSAANEEVSIASPVEAVDRSLATADDIPASVDDAAALAEASTVEREVRALPAAEEAEAMMEEADVTTLPAAEETPAMSVDADVKALPTGEEAELMAEEAWLTPEERTLLAIEALAEIAEEWEGRGRGRGMMVIPPVGRVEVRGETGVMVAGTTGWEEDGVFAIGATEEETGAEDAEDC